MTTSSVSSENPSREFSNLTVIMGTPKIATGVKYKDSPGDCVLRFCRLANSSYLGKKKKHQKSEVEGTLKISLPGICSLPRLVLFIVPLETHWIHPLPQLTGNQEMCCEPWFPWTLWLTSLTPDPSPSIPDLSVLHVSW